MPTENKTKWRPNLCYKCDSGENKNSCCIISFEDSNYQNAEGCIMQRIKIHDLWTQEVTLSSTKYQLHSFHHGVILWPTNKYIRQKKKCGSAAKMYNRTL